MPLSDISNNTRVNHGLVIDFGRFAPQSGGQVNSCSVVILSSSIYRVPNPTQTKMMKTPLDGPKSLSALLSIDRTAAGKTRRCDNKLQSSLTRGLRTRPNPHPYPCFGRSRITNTELAPPKSYVQTHFYLLPLSIKTQSQLLPPDARAPIPRAAASPHPQRLLQLPFPREPHNLGGEAHAVDHQLVGWLMGGRRGK